MQAIPMKYLHPTVEAAPEFASLPYDVFDRAEAKAYVEAHPNSFLAIDRPETQFPDDQDMYAPEVYQRAREMLNAAEENGTLVADEVPCYYLYRQTRGEHIQTGIVAGCSIDDYADGTIKKHENTRAEKLGDRITHIATTGAHTGPIFLAFRDDDSVARIVAEATLAEPLYDFVGGDGVRDTVWRIADAATVAELKAAFDAIPCAYIADGHHRCASAAQVGLDLRAEKGEGLESDHFLSVLFPASELLCLPYNRVVADHSGKTADEVLDAIRAQGFEVVPSSSPVEPARRGDFGVYVGESWYTATIDPALVPDDPVLSLDAQMLQDRVLAPVLGIDDPTSDGRISFVGGIRGTAELERRAGSDGVAFSLFATGIDQVMAVADAGRLMPPKSTWFEPKLKSGLFIHRI